MAVYPAASGNPTIARWHVPDPLAEKFTPFSPYNYCLGNPVNYIDPDGREVVTFSGDAASRFFDNWINGKWGYSVDNLFEAIAESGGGGGSYMGGAYLGKEYNFTIVDAYGRYTLMSYLGDKPVFKLKDGGIYVLNSEKSSSSYVCSFEKVFTAQGGGDSDITQLFGKYNAGYIADANSNQLFPNQTYDRDKVVTRYMIEGVGVWILGMVNTGLGAVSGGLAVTLQGQEHIFRMKAENYLQNGQGMGIYVINVSAPGAFPRAMLFNAVDGSSIGWHHTIVKGAPTMQYHIYLKFLQELNTLR